LIDFRAAGWEVTGCEPSAHACQVAARHGIILQTCAAEEAQVPNGVTYVYMNNVFEHLHDPLAVLAKSRAALAPGGLIVLIVPNHDSWSARLFGAAWPGYDPPRHLWGYTPRAIRMLLQGAGFDIVSVSQKHPLSDYCWFSGISGYRAQSVAWRALRARMARVMRRLLVPAGALAALCGHGDYIYVVARKGASPRIAETRRTS
jgi:SAM-dependent methyltransferase